MDAVEKRIMAYGIIANLGSVMAIIGLLGTLGIINQLAMTIIEIVIVPNMVVIGMFIRYRYKINIDKIGDIPIPETPAPVEPVAPTT